MNVNIQSGQSLHLTLFFEDQELGTGTGFVAQMAKGYVLITNRHIVTGRDQTTNQPMHSMGGIPDRMIIRHHDKKGLGYWTDREESLVREENPLWIEHPALGDKVDVVALPLTNTDGVNLFPYDLTDEGPDLLVRVTELVSVVGFPFGLAAGGSLAIWATGFIASEPDVNYDNLPVFLIDCRSRKGQSGSPVIMFRNAGLHPDSKGNVQMLDGPATKLLGVYSGRINDESDIGKVWKLSAVRELLNSI